jgi:hypothetical protein
MRWVGHVVRTGEKEVHAGFWWGSLTGRPIGRLKHRWEDNIKMDLQEVGWEVMDWIELAGVRGRWWALVNAVMNLRVP